MAFPIVEPAGQRRTMPQSKRSTVVAKIDFENVNNAQGNETTLGDELKEYLNAPPLISGYLERETRKAAGGVADGEGTKKRWWCQLKGSCPSHAPFLLPAASFLISTPRSRRCLPMMMNLRTK